MTEGWSAVNSMAMGLISLHVSSFMTNLNDMCSHRSEKGPPSQFALVKASYHCHLCMYWTTNTVEALRREHARCQYLSLIHI